MRYTVTLLLCLAMLGKAHLASSQAVNLALSAVATHSGGGASPNYGPALYNNGVIPPPNSAGILLWGWVSTNGWIEFTWPSPQMVAKVKLHKQNRPLTNATLQYWNGSAYVNIMTYSSTTNNITDSMVFPPVQTTKIRLANCLATTNPSGNPNHGEIEIFGPAFPNDMSATAILSPVSASQQCYFGGTQVKVMIWNAGSDPQTNFPVYANYSGPGGSGTITSMYTGTLNPGMFDSLVVGTINSQPGNYNLFAYAGLAGDQFNDNDTTGTISFAILPPVNGPEAISDTVCLGDAAQLQALGPVGTQFNWYSASSGGNLMHSGPVLNFPSLVQDTTLFVTATLNGCESVTVQVNAVVGPPPVVSLGNDTSFCESLPLILDAGNPGGDYTWSTGDTTRSIILTNQSGTYWVTVDKYCLGSDTVQVDIAPLARVNGISYIRMGHTYHFSPTNPQFVDNYFWDFGDGNTSTLQSPVHSFSYAINVESQVRLIVSNVCGADSVGREVPTSIVAIEGGDEQIQVYPNPAKDLVTIDAGRVQMKLIQVLSATGTVVAKQEVNDVKATLSIQHLPSGNYFIRIQHAEGVMNERLQIVR